ncbi:MAG: FKBP-type peptidyl-prolyl cis-trans isomerase [Saprospiraceae bacterium]|nr:FKBP-type peptidyl-prolyl cis-trans isomerase [Saprospiraceae bacterium]
MKRNHALLLLAAVLLFSCKEGPKTTASGYEYTMHMDVPGDLPKPGEYTYFHVTMRAGDSLINSSAGMSELPRLRIPEDPSQDAAAPIIEGLRLMSVGDSMTLIFPLDSMPSVPPAFAHLDEIAYDLKLVEIKSEEAFQEEMQAAAQAREARTAAVRARQAEVSDLAQETLAKYLSKDLDDIKDGDNGLQYVIHEPGNGKKPVTGKMISVQYYGLLDNGLMFDNSFQDGEPYTFPIGRRQVIAGWDEGLMNLSEGARASLFIPSELGYGASGYQTIPGGANLYFYVELEKVNQ